MFEQQTVTLSDFGLNYLAWMNQVEKGKELVVTNHGKPMAIIRSADYTQHIKNSINSIKTFRQKYGTQTDAELRAMIEEGRP